jgi:hypothetical protein
MRRTSVVAASTSEPGDVARIVNSVSVRPLEIYRTHAPESACPATKSRNTLRYPPRIAPEIIQRVTYYVTLCALISALNATLEGGRLSLEKIVVHPV